MNTAKDTKQGYVYMISTDTTHAFLCPYKTFQRLNEIYAVSPTAYKLRRDFGEMEAGFEASGKVEMLDGVFVARYPLVL